MRELHMPIVDLRLPKAKQAFEKIPQYTQRTFIPVIKACDNEKQIEDVTQVQVESSLSVFQSQFIASSAKKFSDYSEDEIYEAINILHRLLNPNHSQTLRSRFIYVPRTHVEIFEVHMPGDNAGKLVLEPNKRPSTLPAQYAERQKSRGATTEQQRATWIFYCRELVERLFLGVDFVRDEHERYTKTVEGYAPSKDPVTALWQGAWKLFFGEDTPIPDSLHWQSDFVAQLEKLPIDKLIYIYNTFLDEHAENSVDLGPVISVCTIIMKNDSEEVKEQVYERVLAYIHSKWLCYDSLEYSDDDYAFLQESLKEELFLAIQPKHIEPELRRFSRDLHQKLHSSEADILDIVSWAHMRMVEIHPWNDGNGSAARALVCVLLMQNKVFPMPWFDHFKLSDYKDAVEVSSSENIGRLKEFFLAELVSLKERLSSRESRVKSYQGPLASAGFFDPARMLQQSSDKKSGEQVMPGKRI